MSIANLTSPGVPITVQIHYFPGRLGQKLRRDPHFFPKPHPQSSSTSQHANLSPTISPGLQKLPVLPADTLLLPTVLERPLPVSLAPGLPTRACSLSHTSGLACPRAFAFAPSLWPEKSVCSQIDPSLFRSCPDITSPDGLPSPKVTTHHYPVLIPYFHHTTSLYQKIHCLVWYTFPRHPLRTSAA